MMFSFLALFITSLLNLFTLGDAQTCNFHYPGYVPTPGDNRTIYLPVNNGTFPSWGDCANSSACSLGQTQSPIDLVSSVINLDTEMGGIEFNWRKADNVSLAWTGNNQLYGTPPSNQVHPSWIWQSLIPNNDTLYLNQFHLHSPSEHTIDGQRMDAEVHFVHMNSFKNVTAVVSFLLKVGTSQDWSELFEVMLNDRPDASDPADVFTLTSIYPALALSEVETRSYYHYIGSLTTPPCTEGVYWFVMKDQIMINQAQLDSLKQYQTANNRPTQPLNNRKISAFEEVPETFCSEVGSDCATCQDQCKKTCKKTCETYSADCSSTCNSSCQKKMCSEVC